jgi:hypothetical protein
MKRRSSNAISAAGISISTCRAPALLPQIDTRCTPMRHGTIPSASKNWSTWISAPGFASVNPSALTPSHCRFAWSFLLHHRHRSSRRARHPMREGEFSAIVHTLQRGDESFEVLIAHWSRSIALYAATEPRHQLGGATCRESRLIVYVGPHTACAFRLWQPRADTGAMHDYDPRGAPGDRCFIPRHSLGLPARTAISLRNAL